MEKQILVALGLWPAVETGILPGGKERQPPAMACENRNRRVLPGGGTPLSTAGRFNPCAVSGSSRLQEVALLQLAVSLLEFLLGVHHNRAIPGDRFLEGLARDEEKTDSILAGLDFNFIAAVEEY